MTALSKREIPSGVVFSMGVRIFCLSACVSVAFGGPQAGPNASGGPSMPARPSGGGDLVPRPVGGGDASSEILNAVPEKSEINIVENELWFACPAECWSCSNSSMSCGGRGLTAVPTMPTSGTWGVTGLYLQGNSLRELPDKALQSLSGLTEFRADYNQVTLRLRKYSFYGLWRLQKLLLYRSNIEYLPDGLFYGLSKLTNLQMHGNRIHRLQADVFIGLPLSGNLSLYDNQVPLMVEDFAFRGAALDLPTLRLDGCRGGLSLSGQAFDVGLFKVTQIHLQKSKLGVIKADTFLYQELLKVVHLEEQGSGQGLVLEPWAFNGSVQEVYLGGNNLTTLPGGLFSGGSEITKLDLSNNNLTTLPPRVFSPLTKLSYVDIRRNRHISCQTIDELKEMSLTTLAHDSCTIYPSLPATPVPFPANLCRLGGAGLPPAFTICPAGTNHATTCGAAPGSNCCWVEVGTSFGVCIVNPNLVV